MTDSGVAVPTKQFAHFSSGVTMIDRQPRLAARGWALANRAKMVLSDFHFMKLLYGQPKFSQSPFQEMLALGRMPNVFSRTLLTVFGLAINSDALAAGNTPMHRGVRGLAPFCMYRKVICASPTIPFCAVWRSGVSTGDA